MDMFAAEDLLLFGPFDAAAGSGQLLFPWQLSVHLTLPTLRLGTSYE